MNPLSSGTNVARRRQRSVVRTVDVSPASLVWVAGLQQPRCGAVVPDLCSCCTWRLDSGISKIVINSGLQLHPRAATLLGVTRNLVPWDTLLTASARRRIIDGHLPRLKTRPRAAPSESHKELQNFFEPKLLFSTRCAGACAPGLRTNLGLDCLRLSIDPESIIIHNTPYYPILDNSLKLA
jgi:hypothetical protein